MEVIDSDERMTKRMSRRGGRGSVEAGGVMAVEKQMQMQPESERACRRGRGRGDTRGGDTKWVGGRVWWAWWNPWEIAMG